MLLKGVGHMPHHAKHKYWLTKSGVCQKVKQPQKTEFLDAESEKVQ